MLRDQYTWLGLTDFSGGINEAEEEAQGNQVADARNVWVKNRLLVQRPGYVGVGVAREHPPRVDDTIIYANHALAATVQPNIFDLSGALAGTYWYIGLTLTEEERDSFAGLGLRMSDRNSAYIRGAYSFWDGSKWEPILHVHKLTFENSQRQLNPVHLAGWVIGGGPIGILYRLSLGPLNSWVKSTIATYERYWLRVQLVNIGSAALTNPTRLDPSITYYRFAPSGSPWNGALSARCPEGHFYCTVTKGLTSVRFGLNTIVGSSLAASRLEADITLKTEEEPASFASIPTYNRAFAAYGGMVVEFILSNNLMTRRTRVADVEQADYLVGEIAGLKALYHSDYIAQHSAVPKAKYLAYFDHRLWAANLIEDPHSVNWSAPNDAFRVWPVVSNLRVVEDDQSPITGLKAFGEHLAVFKQDSIWRIIKVGEDGLTGLNTYSAIKIPGGIGTVSNSSIQDINGVLIFLAEDGIYAFDGVNKPTKISDPVDNFIKRIAPGRRKFVAGVHWRRENCYLLSIPLDGSVANNLVLVYDYILGAWWVWDNMEVQCWMIDEDEYDNEKLYFSDMHGYIFQFGIGDRDNYEAIESYVETHRINANDERAKSFREVRLYGQAEELSNMTVTCKVDDRVVLDTFLDWSSELEPKVGDGSVVGGANAWGNRRDKKKLNMRQGRSWVTVRVGNSEMNKKMALKHLKVGVMPHGLR